MKNFILVAGTDYSHIAIGETGTNFNVYCDHWQKILYNKEKGTEDLNFYFVDMKDGEIRLVKYAFDATANVYKMDTSIHKKFDPVTKLNFYVKTVDNKNYLAFHPRGKSIISKYDIYNLVAQIGIDSPGTLKELMVYSHAYLYGPILVNSWQSMQNYIDPFDGSQIDVEGLGYDPNDFDMRVWDFQNYYASYDVDILQKKANMIAAFSNDSVYRIWGCNQIQSLNYFFAQLRSHRSFKVVGLINTDEFVFSPGLLKDNIRDNIAYHVGLSRGIVDFKITKQDTVVLTWLEIKKFICSYIMRSYAYAASKFFLVDVIGALPTTDANFTKTGYVVNPATIKNIPIFENYFGFKIETDGEARNYARFSPDFNCTDHY